MATITRVSLFGPASLTFSFDDVAKTLTRVQASNPGPGTLRVDLEAPFALSRTLLPGGSIDVAITTARRPTYQETTVLNAAGQPVKIITGFTWRTTYG